MKYIAILFFTIVLTNFSNAKTMNMVDLLNVPSVNDGQLSPDGEGFLFVKSKADWQSNKNIRSIWYADINGEETFQISSNVSDPISPRWSPNGDKVLFLSKRSDDQVNQIYIMPSSCGEAQRISNHATSIASAEWSHDGKSIYFLASDRKDQSQIDNEELGDDIFKFEQDFKQRHLWNISIDDYTKTHITDGDYSVTRFKLSEDGEKILHHRAPSPLLDAALENEIWMMDHDGKNAKQITSNQNPEGGAELSPDNNSILFLSWTNENDEPYFENNLFLTNIKGDKPQQLLSTFDHDIEEAHCSKDGNSIYFNANLGVHNELFKYNISTKEITQLSNGNHTVNNWQYNPDLDAHLMSIKTADNNGDYCICNQIALCLKK